MEFEGKPLVERLTPEQSLALIDCTQIGVLSALATRDYSGLPHITPYCNSDNFELISIEFVVPGEKHFLRHRVRDLVTGTAVSQRSSIQIPYHVSNTLGIYIDQRLVAALLNHRSALLGGSNASQWPRWQEAIYSFNYANSDRSIVPQQVDWLLMCSAFQRVLDATSDAADVAKKFHNILIAGFAGAPAKFKTLIVPLQSARDWIAEFTRSVAISLTVGSEPRRQ